MWNHLIKTLPYYYNSKVYYVNFCFLLGGGTILVSKMELKPPKDLLVTGFF